MFILKANSYFFSNHLETKYFSNGSMTNPIYIQMMPNEQIIRFKESFFFVAPTLSFQKVYWNFEFLFEIFKKSCSPMT